MTLILSLSITDEDGKTNVPYEAILTGREQDCIRDFAAALLSEKKLLPNGTSIKAVIPEHKD